MSKTVIKQITFPIELLKFLEPNAAEYGYTLPGYVRYLLTKEMEKENNRDTIIVDEELIADIKAGNKEFEEGKLTTLKTY